MRLAALSPLLVAGLALAWATPARAEYPEHTPYLGLHLGGNIVQAPWDFGHGAEIDGLTPAEGAYPLGGVRFGWQFSHRFAIEGGVSYHAFNLNNSSPAAALEYDVDGLYHLTLSDWAPYLIAGVGGYHLVAADLDGDFDPTIHVGVGLRGLFTPTLALRLEARQVWSDGYGDPSQNTELRAGLDIFLAKPVPDRDKDGIADADDVCPDVFGVASAKGCPDRDGDTVADTADTCPDTPGKPELQGCVDTDADGLADVADTCPTVAGPKELGGCPDTDGDKILDKDDSCPAVAGKAEFKGCPDTDGDGITDASDVCPQVPGTKATGGCPDRDHDTVVDSEDKCPDVRGMKAYQGCVPDEVKKFTGAIKGINFETGKSTIKKESFPTLDHAVDVLKKFPDLRLLVEGHTDDVGDDASNLKLSQDRAAAVREYLVGKGIDAARLQAQGFGETKPVGDNKTTKGKAQNRRIEFTIIAE